jgi:hypothetical protein
MLHNVSTTLRIAILLGVASATPALAQSRSHHVVHRHVTAIPCACPSNVHGGYAMNQGRGERQRLGETRALPWIQDPRER